MSYLSIRLKDLPDWARNQILTSNGLVNMRRGEDVLTIVNGVSVFNGILVSEKDGEVETVRFIDLPSWAQAEVIQADGPYVTQRIKDNDVLQINGDHIFFNGLRVIKK